MENKTKTRYLDLMQKSLSAYSNEHIFQYFDTVKKDGLTEHGFPRLVANIGILIAHGRRLDLLPIFLEMMEFCCKTIPTVKAANDFSVREIICCIMEIEKTNAVCQTDVARWKGYLATINPETCYNVCAKTPEDSPNNWAMFTGVSEYFRQSMGLCNSSEFIDLQIFSQLKRFDENGMYMDRALTHNPIMYDIVPRVLVCILLFIGYKGPHYEKLDSFLKKAGLLTLNMQSVTGEMAFGGRSNQLLLNEAWLSALLEYEARRYKLEGNLELAKTFKTAAAKAVENTITWLSKNPISHVKNRYPSHLKFGCERYGYFDKYMISVASFFYLASLFCDDDIEVCETQNTPLIWSTSTAFHKVFVKRGDYFLEFDTNADTHYDANGLGRIHKRGAPSAICLSVPFPKDSAYSLGDTVNNTEFAIAPSLMDKYGEWRYGCVEDTKYSLISHKIEPDSLSVQFDCELAGGERLLFSCMVTDECVKVHAKGNPNQKVGITLPVFSFDGELSTKTSVENGKIEVEYDGWTCQYNAQSLLDLNTELANRNGLYKGYIAQGEGEVEVQIKIFKAKKLNGV